MEFDCTLDALKIPALPTYTNEFGTKKSSGGLSTAECSDDIMLPFRKMRPYEVSETSTTTDIQHNAVFVMKTAGITLTLHDCSTDFLGCEARVINVSSGDVTVEGGTSGLDGGTGGVTIPSKREARFIFLSDGWHSSYAEYLNITDKELASSSVTTDKIADENVTTDKIADSAVTNDKIAGTIPVSKGGTGATTALGAEYNILGSVGLVETTPSDTSYLALRNSTLSSTNGTFRWTKCANIWSWIQSKISSVLGLTASSYSGNAKTATSANTMPYTTAENTVCVNAYQTSESVNNSEADWASYLCFNHGNGTTYFHQMLRLPFFSNKLQYQRRIDGTLQGWATIPLEGESATFSTVTATTFSGNLSGTVNSISFEVVS